MTKSRMKGWIVALAALAAIGTAGTATAGYLTKGFTDWKVREKQPKADEGKKEEGKASDGGGKEETPAPEPVSPEAPKAQARALGFSGGPKRAVGNLPANFVDTLHPIRKLNVSDPGAGSANNVVAFDKNGDAATNGNVILRFSVPRNTAVFGPALCYSSGSNIEKMVNPTGFGEGVSPVQGTLVVNSAGEWDSQSFVFAGPNISVKRKLDASGADDFYVIVNVNDIAALTAKDFLTDRIDIGTDTECTLMWSESYGYSVTHSKGLVSGQTKDIFIDVDRGYSADAIISSVSAVDLFGADVPVTVTDGKDAFDATRIGVYTLKVKATDSYGQTANATLIVHICDYVKPEIRSVRPMTFTADKGQRLTYADIASYVTVTDNGTAHGSSLTVEYSVDGTRIDTSYSHEWAGADVGSHTLTVHAKDGTGNENTVQASITVNDGTAPVLSRRDGLAVSSKITVGVSKTFTMQISDVTQLFKATDNVDGDVSDTLAGNTDADRDFFRNNHKAGEYTLTIRAQDRSGNVITQAIPVEFIADIPPVFIVADTLVYTDTASPLDVGQLNAIVSNALLAGRKNVSARVVDDGGYLGHENEPGNYNVTYEYTEIGSGAKSARRAMRADSPTLRTGSFTIVNRRAEKAADEAENKGRGFFRKVADWFRAVGKWFEKLWNWFRGVFNHFDFRCFIDNEDYAAKYPRKSEAKDSAQPAPASQEQAPAPAQGE